ncbi:MAG: replicative DNA helicase [Candidatus Promineifilaceae bacterium]
METIERLPPQSIDAEEAVLGSLLIDPDAIHDVATFLKPESFYREQNKWIYEAILNLYERREPVDLITLTEKLSKNNQLSEMGGEAYLISLINTVPTSVNAESYARLVEAAAMRRKMIKAASAIANLAYDETEDIEIVIDRAEQTLFAVTEERTTRDLVPVREVARTYLDRIQALADLGQDMIGIPTGFTDLDRIMSGLNRSDLVIVAARPGMGKTALQLSIAQSAGLRYAKRVAIFSMEMSAEQLVQRMIAAETRIDSQRLRRGNLQDQEWPIFYEAVGRLSETSIFIDDTPGVTPSQLRTKCRRLYAEHGLDLILIDYLQLMQSDRFSNNRVQEISDISRGLKNLARELDVPVLAAAQLSRAVEQRQDKRPVLSDLRDSGSIEQDADIVMFIYRDEYYNPDTTERPNIAEINIAKHRNGPTATIDLYWHSKLATFRNLQRQELNL